MGGELSRSVVAMEPGDVVDARYEIVAPARSGGCATVYRARDLLGGGPVAVKILHTQGEVQLERFAREGRALAELDHPGIVRYVDQGRSKDGVAYLAMEWLEGEDLEDRRQRSWLGIRDSLVIARQAAVALGFAHERGVVHRDIKPSNLFLLQGEELRVKVLDFGIARWARETRPATQTGTTVGTPGYMAPEQARGSRDIDARADVFSLGCVLYECLSGAPAFLADDVLSLLAKILLEKVPHVSDARGDVPAALDELVYRMMAKDRAERPADGGAVVQEIDAVLGMLDSGQAPSRAKPPTLTTGEQRLLCVVVAAEAVDAVASGTLPGRTPVPRGAATMRDAIEAAARAYGAQFEGLADGSILATLTGSDAATDLVTQAARLALALRAMVPLAPMAVATGRGILADRWPVGEVLDRAARLLRKADVGPATRSTKATAVMRVAGLGRPAVEEPADSGPEELLSIALDDVSAGLLDERFELARSARGLELCGEREAAWDSPLLLGQRTPCVGRERELGMLDLTFAECVEEPVARCVLLTGPPGIGKSRLAREFLARREARGERPELWLSRGDPLRAGQPFGLLAQAGRRAAGILEGEPLAVRQKKLRARIARTVAADRQRVTEFVGESLGVPYPDDGSVQLLGARQDPMLMADQVRRSWEDWLLAECDAGPFVLVLEDVHHGDSPSVAVVENLFRLAEARPFFLLAFARPEVHERFPQLLADGHLLEIPVGQLGRRAAEKLARSVLGEDAPEATVQRIVEQAAGNAFFLEELLRSAAEGKGDTLPGTVLAMVHARLEGLPAEARRVLRAASIVGETFFRGALAAMLGEAGQGELAGWLRFLLDHEVIVARGEGKFPGEEAYAFRHALLKEAVYATLTDGDRKLGHRLAAEWLEAVGETEAVVVATHLARAEDDRALGWYTRAAEQALEANDLGAAIERADHGIACGARGEQLGRLKLVQAEAYTWRSELTEAKVAALDAMRWLAAGSVCWYSASGVAISACANLGEYALLVELVDSLPPASHARQVAPQVVALARASVHLRMAGLEDLAERLASEAELVAAGVELEPAVGAWLARSRGLRAMLRGESDVGLAEFARAVELFERGGSLRLAVLDRVNMTDIAMEVGCYREAEYALTQALPVAQRLGLDIVVACARMNLGYVRWRLGDLGGARELLREAVAAFARQGAVRTEGTGRSYLALVMAEARDLEAAEAEARRALSLLAGTPPERAHAEGALAKILLARGDAVGAEKVSREALARIADGVASDEEALVRLVLAEALERLGRKEESRAALTEARARLLERAARISNAALRDSFLRAVPENAKTLELSGGYPA